MITLVEALHYRCLKHVRQPLGRFHVLVGPNGSGKTALLDALDFLADLAGHGLEAALDRRCACFHDLVWQRSGGRFELAAEARVPERLRPKLENPEFDTIRYEVAVGAGGDGEPCLLAEKAVLRAPLPPRQQESPQRELFPMPVEAPATILGPRASRGSRTVLNKNIEGHDNYYDETGRGWDHSFKLGPRKPALGSLPDDESKFPAASWFKDLLMRGVRRLAADPRVLSRASAPGQGREVMPDGSNLPWVVARLEKTAPDRFAEFVAQLRSALPGFDTLRVAEREDDRHRYLVLGQQGGIETPSWVSPGGALRLIALTLPAFLPGFSGIWLIEEPENGLHPRAVEAMFRCLGSIEEAQVLLATHSPVILGVARLDQVLCLAKTGEGATDIVRGDEHPALKHWRGELDLSSLFAGGVLG